MGEDWQEVGNNDTEGKTWNPEAGDSIIGKYKELEENVGPNDSMMYKILEEDATEDEVTSVWGSTVLDKKMKDVSLGSTVKIVYQGKVKGKTASYKDFKVFVKPL